MKSIDLTPQILHNRRNCEHLISTMVKVLRASSPGSGEEAQLIIGGRSVVLAVMLV
jgi:hypothetical protein